MGLGQEEEGGSKMKREKDRKRKEERGRDRKRVGKSIQYWNFHNKGMSRRGRKREKIRGRIERNIILSP